MNVRESLDSKGGNRRGLLATIVAAVFALALVPSARAAVQAPGRTPAPPRQAAPTLRLAEGLIVQPGAGDLEPPAVADDDDAAGYDDQPAARGEDAPAEEAPRPESRQEGLERPEARQDTVERGDARQDDLEQPDGPGQKY